MFIFQDKKTNVFPYFYGGSSTDLVKKALFLLYIQDHSFKSLFFCHIQENSF